MLELSSRRQVAFRMAITHLLHLFPINAKHNAKTEYCNLIAVHTHFLMATFSPESSLMAKTTEP